MCNITGLLFITILLLSSCIGGGHAQQIIEEEEEEDMNINNTESLSLLPDDELEAYYYNDTNASSWAPSASPSLEPSSQPSISFFKYFPTLNNISVMDYSDTYRQSVCDRQRAFSNGTIQFRDALRGLELNVMLLKGAMGGLDPVDGSIPTRNLQMEIIVLDELARRAGFEWRNTFGAVSVENLTGTFDELLDWSIYAFDISAVEWSRTRARINRGTGYPMGHVDASIILVGQQPRVKSLNVWSFLQPFDVGVWLLILLTFVICGAVYGWMEHADQQRSRKWHTPMEYIYFAGLTFIGDIKLQPTTNHGRLLVISLGFWSLLVSSAYTANLASFLVSQNTPVLNIEKISDAVRLQIPICAIRSASPAVLLQEEFPNARLVEIDNAAEGYAEVYQALFRGECQLVLTTVNDWERDSRDPTMNPYCDLERVGRVYKFLPAGFAVEVDSGVYCTYLIQAVLNLYMLEMEEDGFMSAKTQLVLDSEAKQNCHGGSRSSAGTDNSGSNGGLFGSGDGEVDVTTGDDYEEQQLNLQNLGGLFICMYVILAVTCLMALWQGRRQRLAQHRNELKNQASTSQHDLSLKEEGEEKKDEAGDEMRNRDRHRRESSNYYDDDSTEPTSSRRMFNSPPSTSKSNQSSSSMMNAEEKLDHLTREMEFIKEMMLMQQYGKSKGE